MVFSQVPHVLRPRSKTGRRDRAPSARRRRARLGLRRCACTATVDERLHLRVQLRGDDRSVAARCADGAMTRAVWVVSRRSAAREDHFLAASFFLLGLFTRSFGVVPFADSLKNLRMNSVQSVRWIAQEERAGSSPRCLTDCRVYTAQRTQRGSSSGRSGQVSKAVKISPESSHVANAASTPEAGQPAGRFVLSRRLRALPAPRHWLPHGFEVGRRRARHAQRDQHKDKAWL
jgi:hypothetical protein